MLKGWIQMLGRGRFNILNFNKDVVSKDETIPLAEHIELFLYARTEIMYIPKDLVEEEYSEAKAIKKVRKLIKKLRKGKKGVFNDDDSEDYYLGGE
jgi:hypothetical protein